MQLFILCFILHPVCSDLSGGCPRKRLDGPDTRGHHWSLEAGFIPDGPTFPGPAPVCDQDGCKVSACDCVILFFSTAARNMHVAGVAVSLHWYLNGFIPLACKSITSFKVIKWIISFLEIHIYASICLFKMFVLLEQQSNLWNKQSFAVLT